MVRNPTEESLKNDDESQISRPWKEKEIMKQFCQYYDCAFEKIISAEKNMNLNPKKQNFIA